MHGAPPGPTKRETATMQKSSINAGQAYAVGAARNRDDLGVNALSYGLVLSRGGWVSSTYGTPFQSPGGSDHLVVTREHGIEDAASEAEAKAVTPAQAAAYFQFVRDHHYGTNAAQRAEAREALDFPKGWRATVRPSREVVATWTEYKAEREAYLKHEAEAKARRAASAIQAAEQAETITTLAAAAGIDLQAYVAPHGSTVSLPKAVVVELLQRLAAK